MLEVFDELGLKPKVIAGTSIGALFGAAYASGLSARLIKAHTEEVLSQRLGLTRYLLSARSEPVQRFLNILPIRSSLLKPELLLDLMLPSKVARDFAHLAIPLKVVATDFYAQEQIVLDSGDLRSAIAASMALPALFTPVTRDGRVLMDGGLVNPLPFDVLKGEADITVAIDVSGASLGPGNRVAAHRLLRARLVLADPAALDRAREAEGPAARHLYRCRGRRVPRARVPPLQAGDDGSRPGQGAAQAPARARAGEPDRRDAAGPTACPANHPRRETAFRPEAVRPAGVRYDRQSAGGQHPCAPGPRIALALGGGSARGLAHIVMLEVFDELGIKPVDHCRHVDGLDLRRLLCGRPVGRRNPRGLREPASPAAPPSCKQFAGKLRGGISTLWSVRSPGIVDNVTLFEMLLPEVLHSDFDSLKIPFLAIAADFYAIEQVILDHGPVIPALAASCALPGMARPVVLEGRVLIDGGYVNPVPYDVVMDRADITVAVDVTGDPQRRPGARVPGTVEAVTGATQLLFHSITREKLKSHRARHFHPAQGRRLLPRSTISGSAKSCCCARAPRTT